METKPQTLGTRARNAGEIFASWAIAIFFAGMVIAVVGIFLGKLLHAVGILPN